MPVRNLHQKPFDEGTRDKLKLYREYLREWLPVFINGLFVDIIQVFDFFARPGFDVEGNPGCSGLHPMVTLLFDKSGGDAGIFQPTKPKL